jgi:hypothetical protein
MGPFREQGHFEVPIISRRKSGLETPLHGRFYREGVRLVFAPPLWYDILVAICIAGGAPSALAFFVSGGADLDALLGLAVMGAGIWAALSNERMSCDTRGRTYARLEGQRLWKRITRGSLSELDALVLTTEQFGVPLVRGGQVIYRLVLHWKGRKEPLLVVEREAHNLPIGSPINGRAGPMLQRGMAYAKALGIPFYDNSHFVSGSPVPVL